MNNSNKLFYFFVLSLIFSNNLQVKYVKYIFFIRIEFSNHTAVQEQVLYFRYYLKERKNIIMNRWPWPWWRRLSLSLSCALALSFPFLHNLSQLRKPRRRVHLAVASACLVCMFDFFLHSFYFVIWL
jgi:hypothetical protein